MADMIHLNSDKLCVIDLDTTGLDCKIHEIIEVCVLYLNSKLEPEGDPFHMFLTPQRPETISEQALKVNKVKKVDLMSRGVDPFRAADEFDRWFKKLGCRRIQPLGHNYHFDKGFMSEWLGFEHYEYYFSYRHRDTATVGLFLNDRADFRAESYPFPKVGLTYLCNQLNVDNPARHTALGDCLATAAVYRELMFSGPMTL